MPIDKPTEFTRLTDGTLLLRQADGSYRPVQSESDRTRLASLAESEIERMAESDPDHPALDGAFWAGAEGLETAKEAIMIWVDGDVLSYFRRQGTGLEAQINKVLRRHVDALVPDHGRA